MEIKTTKKMKTSVYLSLEDELILNELFIKRLRERDKTDQSALLCEGLRLLYAKEFQKTN